MYFKNCKFVFLTIFIFQFLLNPCLSSFIYRPSTITYIGARTKSKAPTFPCRTQKRSLHSRSLCTKNFKVLSFKDSHISLLKKSFCRPPWHKPPHLFDDYWHEQQNMKRHVLLAFLEDTACGYITLKWQSLYPSFQEKNIPELSDLNVLPEFRFQGIGFSLLEQAEEIAKERGYSHVGLGVGLYKDYGHAQKLYIKKGYVPDGNGVTYNYLPVQPGKSVPLDDDLILWFEKAL